MILEQYVITLTSRWNTSLKMRIVQRLLYACSCVGCYEDGPSPSSSRLVFNVIQCKYRPRQRTGEPGNGMKLNWEQENQFLPRTAQDEFPHGILKTCVQDVLGSNLGELWAADYT